MSEIHAELHHTAECQALGCTDAPAVAVVWVSGLAMRVLCDRHAQVIKSQPIVRTQVAFLAA